MSTTYSPAMPIRCAVSPRFRSLRCPGPLPPGSLRKQLFCFSDDRIAVEFWYEHSSLSNTGDALCRWFRTYGIEHWVFEREGAKMRSRQVGGGREEAGWHAQRGLICARNRCQETR